MEFALPQHQERVEAWTVLQAEQPASLPDARHFEVMLPDLTEDLVGANPEIPLQLDDAHPTTYCHRE